jgi:hypothetical protein
VKKKLTILLLVLVIPILILTGCNCSIETSPIRTLESGDRFVVTREFTTGNTVYVEMYDKTTKVMYVYVKLSSGGSLTMLVDNDGSPLLYEGEKK